MHVLHIYRDRNIFVDLLENFLEGAVSILVVRFTLVALELCVFVKPAEMHRHLALKLRQVCYIRILYFLVNSTQPIKIFVVTNDNLSVTRYSNIGLNELRTVLKALIECLKSVLWCLPATASVCNYDVAECCAFLRVSKLSPLLMQKTRVLQQYASHNCVKDESIDPPLSLDLPPADAQN